MHFLRSEHMQFEFIIIYSIVQKQLLIYFTFYFLRIKNPSLNYGFLIGCDLFDVLNI